MGEVIDLKAYLRDLQEMDTFVSMLAEQYESHYHEPPETDCGEQDQSDN